ncbi:unnamed protein product [Paramecium octaurelia]|uniref:Oxysterol-binding protein n=1 Tax=Paramecium octaurelia TaxID=43137 RepID=A0A8S1RXW7_PAROT|nr:unnamed protein product [Paramecium octaurelia]
MFGWFKKKKPESNSAQQEEKDESDFVDDETQVVTNEDKELEAKGFDPIAQVQEQDKENEGIADPDKLEYVGYHDIPSDDILQLVLNFKYFPNDEDIRHPEGYEKGGRICADKNVVTKARSVGKEMVKQIGKKILSGSLNLTKVSFPIRVMIPKTALETSVHGTSIFPLYITKATMTPDFLERFKLVITATLSSFFWTNTFLKPLNPILGETLQANYNDGTQVYCEQIMHHPPVSYFLVFGPNKKYKYYGYYLVEGRAGLNSVTIINKGKRTIEFNDGQKIDFDFPNELYSGTFFGQLRQESINKITFTDKANGLSCIIDIGKVKKRTSDFFQADINCKGQKISTVFGTYIGFINFDNVRYWDYRYVVPHKIKLDKQPLESDHKNRSDLQALRAGDIPLAQKNKEILENIQRNDRKLREAFEKQKKAKK